jgi:hypothetical protein
VNAIGRPRALPNIGLEKFKSKPQDANIDGRFQAFLPEDARQY